MTLTPEETRELVRKECGAFHPMTVEQLIAALEHAPNCAVPAIHNEMSALSCTIIRIDEQDPSAKA